jgi:hypothetical protein
MSVNVKKAKRVLLTSSAKNKEPIKEVNAGDKIPAFRQNGYRLNFDSDNSDYLEFNESIVWNNVSDIQYSIDFIYDNDFVSTEGLFLKGSYNVLTTGFIYIRREGENSFRVRIFQENDPSGQSFVFSLNRNAKANITQDGLSLYINGSLSHTFTESVVNITSEYPLTINKASYAPIWYGSFEIYNLTLNAEQFNLEESYGDTITGSSGTVGAINTSNTDANYIDANVWNKKSFALNFEKNENIIIDELNYDFTWIDTNEIDIEVTFHNKNTSGTSIIISKGQPNIQETGYLYLRVAIDTLSFRCSGPSLANDAGISYFLTQELNTVKIKNNKVNVNGVDIYTISEYVCNINKEYINSPTSFLRVGDYAWGLGGPYSDMILSALSFNGLEFNMEYGIGNELDTNNNQVNVDVNGADQTRTVVVTDDVYRHEFRYIEDESQRMKLWRYYGCELVSDGALVILNTDSEGVFRIDGASDFTGGWHGDEEFTTCNFYLDGVLLDLTTNQTGLKGSILTRDYVTDMLETDNPIRTVVANRVSSFNIKYKELDYDLQFNFLLTLSLAQTYMGMSSIVPDYNELIESGNTLVAVEGEQELLYGVDNAVSVNTSNSKEIQTYIIYKELPSSWSNPLLFWLQNQNYNKTYYGTLSNLSVINSDIASCYYRLKFS